MIPSVKAASFERGQRPPAEAGLARGDGFPVIGKASVPFAVVPVPRFARVDIRSERIELPQDPPVVDVVPHTVQPPVITDDYGIVFRALPPLYAIPPCVERFRRRGSLFCDRHGREIPLPVFARVERLDEDISVIETGHIELRAPEPVLTRHRSIEDDAPVSGLPDGDVHGPALPIAPSTHMVAPQLPADIEPMFAGAFTVTKVASQ